MARIDISLPPGVPRAVTSTGSITFIGNATCLIEVGNFTVLTDPNFVHRHEKVPLGFGLDATRLTDPSMAIRDLPPLDCVVLSHFHGDHFDEVAEAELPRDTLIFTTPQAAVELADRGFVNVHGVETWQSADVTKSDASLTVTAMPGQHGPPIVDMLLPDVMGSVLDFCSEGGSSLLRLYITGDTLIVDDLKEIPRRMGDMDLMLIHLGGTKLMGVLVSMDDEQGVEMLHTVPAQMAIPIHYDDYDVFKSPLADFQKRVREAGLEDRVRYVAHGERFEFGLPWQAPLVPKAQRGDDIEYEGESVGEDEVQPG